MNTLSTPRARRVAIMGAAGRDFHNFNVVYRDDPRRLAQQWRAAAEASGDTVQSLAVELARTRQTWREYPISAFFDEEFFETKKVVYTSR